jgi:peptide-methionine (S)-S-oxide reductase
MNTQYATVGGGCFWCLEAAYQLLPGVISVVSGYAGGQVDDPTYEQVCSGQTGHAEVVQIHFDPAVISYERLLEVFWKIHDPTTLNHQGADHGTQYRSVIFYHDDLQMELAAAAIKKIAKDLTSPVVTELATLPRFYPAEAYHQDYYRNHPGQGYCQAIVRPKVEKVTQFLASGFR